MTLTSDRTNRNGISNVYTVAYILGICYDINFGLSEDESRCDKLKEVYAYREQRMIQPEEVALLAELSFLTRSLAQFALFLMIILVLMIEIKGTLKVSKDI